MLKALFSRLVMAFFFLFMGAGMLIITAMEFAFPLLDTLAQWIYGMTTPLSRQPTGSGDAGLHYLILLWNGLMALCIAPVWAAAAKFRAPSLRSYRILRLLMRYYLALIMWGYGCAKLLKSQFPEPSLLKLSQPVGDLSPMGLAWTYMGQSYLYNLFTGGLECLASVLLLFPHTTLLGSLINLGVMSNVLMMNLSYDIPVKINSSMYVLMSIWLIWPARKRLRQFFTNQSHVSAPQELEISEPRPLYKHLIKSTVLVLLFGGILYASSTRSSQHNKNVADMEGVYTVIPATVKQPADMPINVMNWKQLIFSARYNMGYLRVHVSSEPPTSSDHEKNFRMLEFKRVDGKTLDVFSEDHKRLFLTELSYKHEQPSVFKGRLCEIQQEDYSYDKQEKTYLYDREKLFNTCKNKQGLYTFTFSAQRKQTRDYLLRNRGFHLLNEYPFNR